MDAAELDPQPLASSQADCGVPLVQVLADLRAGSTARGLLMRDRRVLGVTRHGAHAIAHLSESSAGEGTLRLRSGDSTFHRPRSSDGTFHYVEFAQDAPVAWVLPFPHAHGFTSAVLINTTSDFGAWLRSAHVASDAAPDDKELKTLIDTAAELMATAAHGVLSDSLTTLQRFLDEWRRSGRLSSTWRPPEFQFDAASFRFPDGEDA